MAPRGEPVTGRLGTEAGQVVVAFSAFNDGLMLDSSIEAGAFIQELLAYAATLGPLPSAEPVDLIVKARGKGLFIPFAPPIERLTMSAGQAVGLARRIARALIDGGLAHLGELHPTVMVGHRLPDRTLVVEQPARRIRDIVNDEGVVVAAIDEWDISAEADPPKLKARIKAARARAAGGKRGGDSSVRVRRENPNWDIKGVAERLTRGGSTLTLGGLATAVLNALPEKNRPCHRTVQRHLTAIKEDGGLAEWHPPPRSLRVPVKKFTKKRRHLKEM
jgi:hypothetical protein